MKRTQIKTAGQVLLRSLVLLLMPVWAYALGLGNIELKSAPGQPLEAEIPLLPAATGELESLSVGMADVATFRGVGMAWSAELDKLKFGLERNPDGAGHIRVYSDEPLQATHLHFLLNVTWSRGRLFREYSLQLETPSPAAEAEGKPVSGGSTLISRLARDNAWSATEPAFPESGNYGPVISSDNLWSIASRFLPDSSVTVSQMMLALLRTNPNAFIANNINGLKKGVILRLPERAQLELLSKQEAFSEALAQNNIWRGGNPAAAATDAELRLVAAADAGESAGDEPVAGPGELADTAADANALALANERIERLSQENAELAEKLRETEVIMEDLKRLIELKDDELAALQTGQTKPVGAPVRSRFDELLAQAKSILEQGAVAIRDNAVLLVALGRENVKLSAGIIGGIVALIAIVLWLFRKDPVIAAGRQRQGPVAVSGPIGFIDESAAAEEEKERQKRAEQRRQEEQKRREEQKMQEEQRRLEEQKKQEEQRRLEEQKKQEEQRRLEEQKKQEEQKTEQEQEEDEEDDRVANKLELARAYLKLGDKEQVRSILSEVLSEGNDAQKQEAGRLQERL